MAPPSALAEPGAARAPGSLKLRVASALVLAPLAVAAAWVGWPWLPLVTALAGAGMAWEWARLCRAGAVGASGIVLVGTALAATAAAATVGIAGGLGLGVLGSAAVFLVADREPGGEIGTGTGRARWLGLGALWLTLPCVLLLWLARPDGAGRATVLWIFAVVWATDIGAYAFGRRVGGPRLAARWSPHKTWAGLAGGTACAALAGWATAAVLGASSALPLAAISAALAIVEQFGDLAESVAKRRFGVKDSSGLIPGHGGLLDRLDGLLAVVPAVAILSAIGGGNVLAWR
jgi:phosphatidate cytidylyltransferase